MSTLIGVFFCNCFVNYKVEPQHTPRQVVCQIVDGDVMNIVDAGQINPQGGSL